jgi:hypothetical protein
VAAVAIGIPYVAWFPEVFGFVRLSWPVLGTMVAIVIAYIAATEVAKRWLARHAHL